jgi:hypothetical protein
VTNWRQILHTTIFELCSAEQHELVPGSKTAFNFYKLIMPNLPSSCPFKPGKYAQENFTFSFTGQIRFPQNPLLTTVDLPNGLYKNDILVHNKDDPKILRIIFLQEVRRQATVKEF